MRYIQSSVEWGISNLVNQLSLEYWRTQGSSFGWTERIEFRFIKEQFSGGLGWLAFINYYGNTIFIFLKFNSWQLTIIGVPFCSGFFLLLLFFLSSLLNFFQCKLRKWPPLDLWNLDSTSVCKTAYTGLFKMSVIGHKRGSVKCL